MHPIDRFRVSIYDRSAEICCGGTFWAQAWGVVGDEAGQGKADSIAHPRIHISSKLTHMVCLRLFYWHCKWLLFGLMGMVVYFQSFGTPQCGELDGVCGRG